MGREPLIVVRLDVSRDFLYGVISMAALIVIGEALELGVGRYANIIGALGGAIPWTIMAVVDYQKGRMTRSLVEFGAAVIPWIWCAFVLFR